MIEIAGKMFRLSEIVVAERASSSKSALLMRNGEWITVDAPYQDIKEALRG